MTFSLPLCSWWSMLPILNWLASQFRMIVSWLLIAPKSLIQSHIQLVKCLLTVFLQLKILLFFISFEWSGYFSLVLNELPVVSCKSQKCSDFSDVRRCWPACYESYLLRICRQARAADDVSKKFHSQVSAQSSTWLAWCSNVDSTAIPTRLCFFQLSFSNIVAASWKF